MHLDIPAGTAVRFEPGEEREVGLVVFGGAPRASWTQSADRGPDSGGGVGAGPRARLQGGVMGTRISRRHYARLFGPTEGDRIRLGDTELWAEVEHDHLVPGDESVFGGGKTLRDGLGSNGAITAADGALDFVITNVVRDRWRARDREVRHRHQGRAHRRDRQGGQPADHGRRRRTDDRGRQHRCSLGRGNDRHRRRDRRARPLRLRRPLRGGDRGRDHDDAGGRPRAGHGRHHLLGDGQPRADAPGLRGVADQLRLPRQGQRV